MIVLDLDGTLLDVAARHHRAYERVLPPGATPLPIAEYWSLKRAGRTWDVILDRSRVAAGERETTVERFVRAIESEALLALDRLHPGVAQALDALAESGPLVLATRRRRSDVMARQLDTLGVGAVFDAVVCGEDKEASLRERDSIPSGAAFVGDTEADVALARAFDGIAIAVTCGLRDAERLAAASPDYLVASLADTLPILGAMA